MIYKFKSKATGDLIMLAAHGDQAMRLLGREPAAQGIFEPADMPAAIATLQAAVSAPTEAPAPAAEPGADNDADAGNAVALRQRLWPLIEALRRAHDAGVPLVWGV
jgi:hypothetical protein